MAIPLAARSTIGYGTGMSDAGEPPTRWSVHHADASAQERARGALLRGGRLVSVLGGPEQHGVPAVEVATREALFQGVDALIVGGDDALDIAESALRHGLHVSAATPVTMSSGAFLRLAHVSRKTRRLLHLYDEGLFEPAFRTLMGHARPNVLKSVVVAAGVGGSRQDDPEELMKAHLPILHRVLLLGGPVDQIASRRWKKGTIEAALMFKAGSIAALTLTSGDVPFLELDAQAQLKWRIEGCNLFAGPSMATLTDTRRPAELGMLEATRLIAGIGTPTLSLPAHLHALKVCEALASGKTGPVG